MARWLVVWWISVKRFDEPPLVKKKVNLWKVRVCTVYIIICIYTSDWANSGEREDGVCSIYGFRKGIRQENTIGSMHGRLQILFTAIWCNKSLCVRGCLDMIQNKGRSASGCEMSPWLFHAFIEGALHEMRVRWGYSSVILKCDETGWKLLHLLYT